MNESRHNLNEIEQIKQNQSFFATPRKFKDISIELFLESDIGNEYLVWLNNSHHLRYSDQQLKVHTVDTSKDYLKSFVGSPNLFLKVLNSSRDMVATLTVYIDANHKVHHCGILVDPNSARKGLGSKAWVALTHHVCPNLGARKVVAGTLENNIAMIKLFEISEMKFEARLREEKQYDGKLYDVLIYSRFYSQ